MPLKRCTSNNKSGWRWGDQGKCYVGPGAKKKAIAQGIAAEGPEGFAAKAAQFEVDSNDISDIVDAVAEVMKEIGYTSVATVLLCDQVSHALLKK